MNSLSINTSLYIPHVYDNYTKDRIINVFENHLKIGKIKSIDLVAKLGKNEKSFNAVYIHFEYWFDNEYAKALQAKVLDTTNKDTKIYYEHPWFWIVLENKSKKFLPCDRKQKKTFDFTELANEPEQKQTQELYVDNNPSNIFEMNDVISNTYLNNEFNEEFEVSTMDEMLYENPDQCVLDFIQGIENELEEDENMITIDGRYIEELENENKELNNQLYIYKNMLQTYYYAYQQPQYQYQYFGYNNIV
jgi:hypothetical protein